MGPRHFTPPLPAAPDRHRLHAASTYACPRRLASPAVLSAWQSWQRPCQFAGTSWPPSAKGTLWSSSVAAVTAPRSSHLTHSGFSRKYRSRRRCSFRPDSRCGYRASLSRSCRWQARCLPLMSAGHPGSGQRLAADQGTRYQIATMAVAVVFVELTRLTRSGNSVPAGTAVKTTVSPPAVKTATLPAPPT